MKYQICSFQWQLKVYVGLIMQGMKEGVTDENNCEKLIIPTDAPLHVGHVHEI